MRPPPPPVPGASGLAIPLPPKMPPPTPAAGAPMPPPPVPAAASSEPTPEAPPPEAPPPAPVAAAASGAVLPVAAVPLRAEVEAGADRTRQAVLLYEIGHIVERDASNDAQAVREYLGAYNQDPQFRPPLFALLRLFERRRSFKNLARLYEAELKSATTGQERASALLDRAALVSDHLGQPEGEQALLEQACDEDGESTAAPLMLEHRARIVGDLEAIRAALQLRAARTKSPLLRGLLLTELASARESADDVDGALETLRAAARIAVERPEDRARFLGALEATARRHDRVPELVAALEGQAALRGSVTDTDAEGPREAAGMLLEAGRLRLVRLGDPVGARGTLDKALALVPDDIAILREHMLACEAEGDAAAAAEDAGRVLARGVTGRHAAPFHFRLAEAAQLEGDVERALGQLRDAARLAPGSAAVRATLEDASLAHGDLSPVLDGLEAQAAAAQARGETEAAIHGYLRAASWARDVGRDLPRAIALYDSAIHTGADRVVALRERQIAVTELGDVAGGTGIQPILDGALALAAEPGLDPDEASVQLRAAYHAALATPYEQAEVRRSRIHAVLSAALDHPRARDEWGADAARMFAAAEAGTARQRPDAGESVTLLIRAHRALADRASGDASAAHLCAAARAAVRAGQEDVAIDLLKTAVAQAPSQRYAITLLEEIYGRRGDADAVVRILREASSAEGGGRAMVGQLLAAGAAAEAAGDRALAYRTYEEAHQKDPDAERPIVALRRLAEAGGKVVDAEQRKSAIERAAAREQRALEAGAEGPAPAQNVSLELGELALVGTLAVPAPAAIEALRRALRVDGTRLQAALALSLTDDAEARLEGVRALVEPTGAASVVLRDQLVLADALHASGRAAAGDDAEDAAEALLARDASDRDALLHRLGATTPGDARRAAALFALADATTDGAAASELVLAGIRATTADALAGRDADDATLRAIEIADRFPESLEAALSYVEAFGDVDDAGERAEALARVLPLLSAAGLSQAEESAIRAEHARALVEAVRGDEALETLATLAEDEDDLSAYEALRVAAREAGAHRLVVRACDRMAEAVEGELRAQLLEEAAAVLMDYLEVDEEAEPRLRAALAVDPTRPIAYARLHDVLSARGDDAGMLALLLARVDVTDDPDALAPLFYEEARLRRALGQRDEALGALENLFLLESEHVGGLALLVEINVQRESWQDAVDALRRLAEAADVPPAQQRIARLGAADFLEKRLGKPDEAIVELRAIEALGLADRGLYERMAAISERASDVDAAVASLLKGAQAATDRGERATLHRRRAQLEARRGDERAAAAAYRDALAAAPLDVEAAEALGRLVAPDERAAVGVKLEESARTALAPDPLEPTLLRTLRSAAVLRGDPALERQVLAALIAARLADTSEAHAGSAPTPALREGARLSDGTLGALRLDGDVQAALELADLANESLLELDRIDPSTFGVGRAELVRGLTPTGGGAPPSVASLVAIAVALGAAPAELYVGGRDPAGCAGVAYRGKPLWVFGQSALEAPTRARFVTAQLALGLRLNVSPLAQRLVRDGLEAAIDALLATSAAAGAPLAVGQTRPGVEALVPRLSKVVSRRARRAAPELAAKLGDGRAVMGYARGLRATLLRVASVVCGDPSPALDVLAGGSGSGGGASGRTERSTRENAEARELLRFWLSPAAQAARRELGVTEPEVRRAP